MSLCPVGVFPGLTGFTARYGLDFNNNNFNIATRLSDLLYWSLWGNCCWRAAHRGWCYCGISVSSTCSQKGGAPALGFADLHLTSWVHSKILAGHHVRATVRVFRSSKLALSHQAVGRVPDLIDLFQKNLVLIINLFCSVNKQLSSDVSPCATSSELVIHPSYVSIRTASCHNCSDVTSLGSPSIPGGPESVPSCVFEAAWAQANPAWTDEGMDGWPRGYGLCEVEQRPAWWRVSHRTRSVKQQASSSFTLARRGWIGVGYGPGFMHHQPESWSVLLGVCMFSILGARGPSTAFVLWTRSHGSLSMRLISDFNQTSQIIHLWSDWDDTYWLIIY